MKGIYHIQSITQLTNASGIGKPRHPLIVVIDLSKINVDEAMTNVKVTTDFYSITLKTKTPSTLKYGRSNIDFEEGCLYGASPKQVLETPEKAETGDFEGYALYFHPDLIKGYNLFDKISEYKFFSYQTNEALHLSEKEKEVIVSILRQIILEYEDKTDKHSQDVLVSNIELLLTYIKRFFDRQFITRKSQNSDLLSSFEELLKAYFNSDILQSQGLPKVQYFSDGMHLSPSYLSDLLKKETGKKIQEHIHYHLIEKAKHLLLNSNISVSEIAFDLGFEYPSYFSRLFKKKMKMTPSEYRNSVN